MKVLAIRFCTVTPEVDALAKFFDNLGLPRMPLPDFGAEGAGITGAIFPAGASWIEMWGAGPQMPVGIMLQVVVDDADAFAAHARSNGLEPMGPTDAHGERIYFLSAPSGLQMSFQSRLAGP